MEEIINEVLQLVKKKMREQGAFSRDAYKQFVVETLDYFIEKGKISEDDNLKFMEDRLMDMWEAVEEKFDEERK